MIKSKIKDHFIITMGQSPKGSSYNTEGKGIPLLTGGADFNNNQIVPNKFTTEPNKISKEGDILIGVRATIGNAMISDQEYCIGRGLASLRIIKDELINNDFITYQLNYNINELTKKAEGSIFKSVRKEHLESFEIYLPSVSEQKLIAKILNDLSIMKSKRKKSISLLDDFLKSTFLEMFGDMITNSKDWKLTEFENVIHLKRGYDLPVKKRISGKYNVVSSSKIIGTHNEYKVNGPGIVTGRSGTIGLVQLIKGDFWPLNTTLYADSINGNDPYFLKYFLEGYKLKRFSQGAGVPTLNRNLFLKNLVPKIPFDLQEKFAGIVKQAELLKTKYQESEKELNNLFGSLMQRAFNGEL